MGKKLSMREKGTEIKPFSSILFVGKRSLWFEKEKGITSKDNFEKVKAHSIIEWREWFQDKSQLLATIQSQIKSIKKLTVQKNIDQCLPSSIFIDKRLRLRLRNFFIAIRAVAAVCECCAKTGHYTRECKSQHDTNHKPLRSKLPDNYADRNRTEVTTYKLRSNPNESNEQVLQIKVQSPFNEIFEHPMQKKNKLDAEMKMEN